MNTLPLAVILQQPSPEIEQSQTEPSFALLHFSKQIVLIPENAIQIDATPIILHINDVLYVFANNIFCELLQWFDILGHILVGTSKFCLVSIWKQAWVAKDFKRHQELTKKLQ